MGEPRGKYKIDNKQKPIIYLDNFNCILQSKLLKNEKKKTSAIDKKKKNVPLHLTPNMLQHIMYNIFKIK